MDELAGLYEKEGYSFIAITDHRLYYKKKSEGFVKLNGCEFNCYLDLDRRYHFHLLTLDDGHSTIPHDDNTYKSLFYTAVSQVQDLIDELKSRNNLVFIAHPMNPHIPLELLEALANYDGIEVYNTKADSDGTKVYAELLMNRELACLAVDDAHQLYVGDQKMFFKGYIVIEDHSEPLEAIRENRYYSTTGVVIRQINYSQRMIEIDTDADVELYVYTENGLETYHQKHLSIENIQKFRVVCKEGEKKAWSNLITV